MPTHDILVIGITLPYFQVMSGNDKLNQYKEKGEEIDLKKIVSDLLLDTIAEDVKGANGVGCDNMTCILIYFDNKTQKS